MKSFQSLKSYVKVKLLHNKYIKQKIFSSFQVYTSYTSAMNIDKFGHHVHKRLRISNPNKMDNVLKLIDEEYNLNKIRLTGLRMPTSSEDAVSKEYMDNSIKDYYTRAQIDLKLDKIKTEMFQFMVNYLKEKYYMKYDVNSLINSLKTKPS